MNFSAQCIQDFVNNEVKNLAKKYYKKPVIRLAQLHRHKLGHVNFIGITGSSGKTTTKELAHSILSRKFNAHKNDDSNNQLYSVARTLLGVSKKTDICIQEIGLSHDADLIHSVNLLQPNIGVVLNVGTDHYKAFRSRENIASEKYKLIQNIPRDGIAILNIDDDLVSKMAESVQCKVFTFGRDQNSDLRATQISCNWPGRLKIKLQYKNEEVDCYTQFCGEHFTDCVLAAIAIGLVNGMPLSDAASYVASFSPFTARMSPFETPEGITFMRDDWKAPYWSIKKSIDFMKNAEALRKIIIIGNLSDYGGTSSTKYRDTCELALEAADYVYFVGPNAKKSLRVKKIPENKTLRTFPTVKMLAKHLKSFLSDGDLVLLKDSSNLHLARLSLMYAQDVKCWRERCGRFQLCDNCKLLTIS